VEGNGICVNDKTDNLILHDPEDNTRTYTYVGTSTAHYDITVRNALTP